MSTLKWIFLTTVLIITGCGAAPVMGGKINSENLKDGTYEGVSKHSLDKAKVKITIKEGRIEECKIIKLRGTKSKKEVGKIIPERIVADQSTDVDAVSGATTLSRTVMNAAQDAINKAGTK